MSRPARSIPIPSLPSQRSATDSPSPRRAIRDRDYLLDRHGVIFKVIGDVHPDGHYLGYVKYHPDPRGDRQLFGQTYRQNTVVSKSFGILAGRPECYAVRAGEDLLAIIARIIDAGAADLFGVTGSFLVGCFNARSDIDLVCYGQAGYEAAHELFADRDVIRPYAGNDLMQLYLRRAKYMAGSNFDALIRLEQRKLQGLTARAGAHINCEPLRSDTDRSFARMYAKEIGEMTLLATITDHEQGMVTPALYRITVQFILSSTVDEPEVFARRITYLRSYLGAYTGAFRTGDTVYLSGKLVHLQDGDHDGFGIELTPWSVSKFYLANLTG